jgi:hypothetical protein
MTTFSPSQMAVLTGSNGGYHGLFGELLLSGGTIRLSSLAWDWSDGAATWLGARGVLSFGEAVSVTGLASAGMVLTWSGASAALMAAARDAQIFGAVFRRYIGVFSIHGVIVGSLVQDFEGLCEAPDIDMDPASPTISITVESRAITLNRPNVTRYTPTHMRSGGSSDSFADFVAALQDKDVFA